VQVVRAPNTLRPERPNSVSSTARRIGPAVTNTVTKKSTSNTPS
jgi:hypothetical protein